MINILNSLEEFHVDSINNNHLKPIKRSRWNCEISDFARYTHNPIRAIVENLKIEPNPDKPMIALSIGKIKLLPESSIC